MPSAAAIACRANISNGKKGMKEVYEKTQLPSSISLDAGRPI
jgi:hypothetical protein